MKTYVSFLIVAAGLTGQSTHPDIAAEAKTVLQFPVKSSDLDLLLRLGLPEDRIEQIVAKRCLSFAVTPELARAFKATGASNSLIGSLAVACRKEPENEIEFLPCPADHKSGTENKGCLGVTSGAEYRRIRKGSSGECIVELMIQGEVALSWQRNLVLFELQGATKSSKAPQVQKLECSQVFPASPSAPSVAKEAGKADIRVVGQPSAANGFVYQLKISDKGREPSLYRFRVSWQNP